MIEERGRVRDKESKRRRKCVRRRMEERKGVR